MRRLPGLAVPLVLVLTGCGTAADPATDGKLSVVTSTNVWGSVVEAVGGSAVGVRSLITDAKGDPHAHQDKPEDATVIAGADLVVYNGGGYDDFFTDLVEGSGAKARKIDAYELSGHGANGGADVDENEHVWYDLPTVRKVADKIAADLGAIDPADKGTFTANAATFDAALDKLATRIRQVGKDHQGARVVATEPVAHYLLGAAGITDATPPEFSEAIEEETDPPASAVAETTDLINDRQVAALVDNEQTETPVTNSLADAAAKAGVPVVGVRETLPPGVTDYVEWMTEQVDDLSSALERS